MHRTIPLLAACLALAGCADEPGREGSTTPTGGERVRVASVSDGDTFRTNDGERVRLLQVDAPEVPEGECHADEARAALERLLDGDVRLERDPGLDDRDRFGRMLRYVVVDGELVNVRLVERGAAAPYFYRGERGRHAGRLLRAARTARQARVGAWGDCPAARLDPNRTWATD